jgi:hypothetical protein
MFRPKSVRLIAVLAGVLAVALMGSASAFAAGKPIVKSSSGGAPSLNELSFNSSVNPNGAATTYYYEYGPTTSYGSSSAIGNLAEGTTAVPANIAVRGFNPYSTTNFRIVATNKYGTTFGSNKTATTRFFYSEFTTFPETYSSKGTFTIEVPSWSEIITCTEKGYGTIGNVGGTGDEYNMELSNCAVTGDPKCKVTVPYLVQLNPNFASKTNPLMFVEMDEETCSEFSMSLPAQEPFKVKMPKEGVEISMPLTAETKFGTHVVKLSTTSTWALSGPGKGKWISWE